MLDDGWFEIMFLQERVSLLRKLERKEGRGRSRRVLKHILDSTPDRIGRAPLKFPLATL